MKLTVITINWNNKQGLEKTMKSVFAQSYTDFEYLIIDGASTDGSVDLIRNGEWRNNVRPQAMENGEFPFHWVSEPDMGIYNAMNKGIRQAKGEYCYFLNSGDYLVSDDVLEKIFADNCTDSFICGNFICDHKGRLEAKTNYRNRDWSFSLYDLFAGFLAHQAFFIRKEMFDKYGLYDERLRIVSDWKLFYIAIGIHREKVAYKDVSISVYDMDGLSSRIGGKVIYAEKLQVIREELPEQLAKKLERLYYLESNGFVVDFVHSKRWIHFLFKVFLKWCKMFGVWKG
ncbi:glycosyltransferase family 2 protein [Viscerimonas tarda]